MAEEEEKTKAGKALKAAKEGLIDLAISYLNTESGLGLLGVEDEELELFIISENFKISLLSAKPLNFLCINIL